MIAECVPGQVGQRTMVLMTVIPIMCQYQVGVEFTFHLFKGVFDGRPFAGEITLSMSHRANPPGTDAAQKLAGTPFRFPRAHPARTEDQPVNLEVRLFLYQTQNGRAATDFDIVAVRTQTKQSLDPVKLQPCHRNPFNCESSRPSTAPCPA